MEKPIALNDWAYEHIKAAILHLKFAPGAQLQIDQLATELDISRTPVREALLRLEQEALVRVVSRVGFFVTDTTPQDLKELYVVREVLESCAVKEAVRNITEADLDYIDQLMEASNLAVANGDVDKFLETEIAFHNFLIKQSRNRRLIAIMESLSDLSYRWRILSLRSTANLNRSLHEHQSIALAVRQRNAERASKLMGAHLVAASERIMQIMDVLHDSSRQTVKMVV